MMYAYYCYSTFGRIEANEFLTKRKQTQEEIKRLQKELASKEKKEMEDKKAVEVKKEEVKIVKEYKEDIEKYAGLKRVKRDLDQTKRNKEDKVIGFFGYIFERF